MGTCYGFEAPQLLLARETLEIGVLVSIMSADSAAFERYITQLQLFYQDGSTPFASSQLRRRYACSSPAPTFHSLRVRTMGTLSSGAAAVPIFHVLRWSKLQLMWVSLPL